MRIAYILPDWPEPTIRGYQRIALERIRRLASRHEIEVFCFADEAPDKLASSLIGACTRVHFVRRRPFVDAVAAVFALGAGDPGQVAYYRSSRMRELIAVELRSGRFNAVVVQLVRMAQYIPEDFVGIRILDMVDPLSLSYARSARWRPWWSRWLYRLEGWCLQRYERRISALFDRVLLISHDDIQEYSLTVPLTKLFVVPYAVDLTYYAPNDGLREQEMIVLSGNLGYGPNVEAVDLFCRVIFPAVKDAVPSVQLWLVGTDPHPRVRRWHDGISVHVTGRVPDLRSYLQRAMVSVCPVVHRMGTQTKILEALAVATPVVAFTETAAGLIEDIPFPVQVASSPEEFGRYVVWLLNTRSQWEILSKESRSYTERNYSWDTTTRLFESLLTLQTK